MYKRNRKKSIWLSLLLFLIVGLALLAQQTIVFFRTPDETRINNQLEQWLRQEFGSHATAETAQIFKTVHVESENPKWEYGIFCAFQYDGSLGCAVFQRESGFLDALKLREARISCYQSCGTDNIQAVGGISICGEPYRAFLSQEPRLHEIVWGLGDRLPNEHYTIRACPDAVLISGPERKFKLLAQDGIVLYETEPWPDPLLAGESYS